MGGGGERERRGGEAEQVHVFKGSKSKIKNFFFFFWGGGGGRWEVWGLELVFFFDKESKKEIFFCCCFLFSGGGGGGRVSEFSLQRIQI